MTVCCLIGVQHARCKGNSVSISFRQNASQNSCSSFLDHFIVIKWQRQSFGSSREAFHDYSHIRIFSLSGFKYARCEDNCLSISFPQNSSVNCSLTLLDHFVVIKRQRQSFGSLREGFHHYSHFAIFCFSGVELAWCKDNCVSISFTQNAIKTAVEAYHIVLLSSKGNVNHLDLHEKLFILIRACEFAV